MEDASENEPVVAHADYAPTRRRMVEEQLRRRDITDPRVLQAMGRVPRDRFVPAESQAQAYDDHPLSIGLGQTISQPYIVALMTQLARPSSDCRALEVGSGSGYQAAILAELCREVYGLEIHRELAETAAQRLSALSYRNVTIRCGDGYQGWPEHSPFDVILVAAAAQEVPPPLIEQLAPRGRLVIPVGRHYQELLLIVKRPDGRLDHIPVAPVQFVRMTGDAERDEDL